MLHDSKRQNIPLPHDPESMQKRATTAEQNQIVAQWRLTAGLSPASISQARTYLGARANGGPRELSSAFQACWLVGCLPVRSVAAFASLSLVWVASQLTSATPRAPHIHTSPLPPGAGSGMAGSPVCLADKARPRHVVDALGPERERRPGFCVRGACTRTPRPRMPPRLFPCHTRAARQETQRTVTNWATQELLAEDRVRGRQASAHRVR